MFKDICIGGDPRNYLEFAEIRAEINKLSHPAAPDVDFALIESLSRELFYKNGLDLQTASYFTFAKTKLEGIKGFSEGCELLANLISECWRNLWPESDTARIEMLDWLNNRVGHDIRTFNFKAIHIPLLLQLEHPLKQITDTLLSLELKKDSSVIELYKFIYNTRKTLEARAASQLRHERQKRAFPLEGQVIARSDIIADAEPQIIVNTPRESSSHHSQPPPVSIKLPLSPPLSPQFKAWQGFVLGLCVASILFLSFLNFGQWQKNDLMDPQLFNRLPQQEIVQYVNDLKSNTLGFHQTDLSVYQRQLTALTNYSPLASHFYADNLSALTIQLFPDSKKAASVGQQWKQYIARQRNENTLSEEYSQAQSKIAGLILQINQADAQGRRLSNSQLKTSLRTIQSQLNGYVPVEELLRQQLLQTPTSTVQIKQIEQRLNGLLAHYHALITDNH